MPAYHPIFEYADAVEIVPIETLKKFKEEWKFHHPLQDSQLNYPDVRLYVDSIGIYHGGDPLYSLYSWGDDGKKQLLPGYWHEQLLVEAPTNWEFQLASEVLEARPIENQGQPYVEIFNRQTGVVYSTTREEQNKTVAEKINVVFAHRDVRHASHKYNFELDFKPN